MSEEGSQNPAVALREEVHRILQDPVFLRAPVQSRLLKFLTDHEVEKGGEISQYAIAVDGLGRPEDYDLNSDSYPRVQMSRLRANLAAYYSRSQPKAGQCVYIRQNEYRLRMASPAIAYPDQFAKVEARPVIADDAAPAIVAEAGAPSADTATRAWWSRPVVLAALVAVAGTAAALFALIAPAQREQREAPYVALSIALQNPELPPEQSQDLLQSVERGARRQLAASFVSRLAADGAATADYEVQIDLGQGVASPDANVRLVDRDSDTLYSATIPFTGDRPAFLQALQATLVYVTGPTGAIAKEELVHIADRPQTAFECFVAIENIRARGEDMIDMVDSCIARFPEHKYASYWHARKAFFAYQQRILRRESIARDGEAWESVLRSLEIDRYNAFGNFVAAKVSVAEGNCNGARVFIDRAFERGSSYPTLTAAALIEASGCPVPDAQLDTNQGLTESLIENNQAPDALLHLYLLLSALSIERPDLADIVADRLVIENVGGTVEATSDSLRNALRVPGYLSRNRAAVEANIARYVWNDTARGKILALLERRDNALSGTDTVIPRTT